VKLELYRRLGRLRSLNHLADFRKEVVDRFGPLTRPAENLLVEAEIRILAGAWKLDRIHIESGQYVVLTYSDSARIEALKRRHPKQVRIVDAKKAYIPLGEDPLKTPEIAEVIRALLRTSG
jgi:transcription-repair coupling factor (superfamily II helicase)